MSDDTTTEDENLALLQERYVAGSPFREDRAFADELMAESSPVLKAILGREEPTHEGLAMLTLLGRRAGTVGATPTAAVALFEGILDVSGYGPERDEGRLRRRLLTLLVEGYFAGREERLVESGHRLAQSAVPTVEIAPRVHAVFFHGEHRGPMIAEKIDAFAARLLRSDALCGLVDAVGLTSVDPGVAAEIFGADASARVIGVPCVFAVSPELRKAAKGLRGGDTLLNLQDSSADGFRVALETAGIKMRARGGLLEPIRRALDPKA